MTWYLPAGETTISPELRPLIANAILHLLSELEAAEDMEFQVPVFDQLDTDQKIVALYKVAFGLMDPKTHAVEHTAALEGCIAALFNLIAEYIDCEINSESGQYLWRDMVRTATKNLHNETISQDADYTEWQICLETLEDEILWDNDWSLSPACKKKPMGIMPKYFTTEVPIPKAGKSQSIRDQLVQFCEGIINE